MTYQCEVCGVSFTADPSRAHRFCSHACYRLHATLPQVIEARFWSFVDKSGGPGACWPWTGGLSPRGYGKFNYRSAPGHKVSTRANRFAYELTHGPLGELFACHSCDNPPCCNPTHIFPGTHEENVADMDRKGRRATGERVPNTSPVTHEQVREIRAQKASGVGAHELGSRYGLHPASINRIVRGEHFGYVT